MELTIVTQDNSSITFGWVPPAGAEYYVFYADGRRVSNAPAVDKNGNVKKTIKFSKGKEPYEVVCVTYAEFKNEIGRYPKNKAVSAPTGVIS